MPGLRFSAIAGECETVRKSNVAARAFADPSVFSLTTEIFVDDTPDNDALANRTLRMTGAGRLPHSLHRRIIGDDCGPGA